MSLLLLTLLLVAFGVNSGLSVARFRILAAGKVDRPAFYRAGLARSVILFLGGGLIVLLFLHRPDAPFHMPEALLSVKQLLHSGLGQVPPFWIYGVAVAWAVVIALASLMGGLQMKRQAAEMTAGNAAIGALLPRNFKERLWCGLISLNAGVAEELFFRMALPLLLMDVTGQVGLSILGSVIIFGLGHAYQGLWGIIVTTVMGTVLAFVYLYSGAIGWAMATHAGVDLWSLVFVPLIIGWGRGPAEP